MAPCMLLSNAMPEPPDALAHSPEACRLLFLSPAAPHRLARVEAEGVSAKGRDTWNTNFSLEDEGWGSRGGDGGEAPAIDPTLVSDLHRCGGDVIRDLHVVRLFACAHVYLCARARICVCMPLSARACATNAKDWTGIHACACTVPARKILGPGLGLCFVS